MKKQNVLITACVVFLTFSLLQSKTPIEKYEDFVINFPEDKLELSIENDLSLSELRGAYSAEQKAQEMGVILFLKLYHNNYKKYKLETDIFENVKDKSGMFILMNLIHYLDLEPNQYIEYFMGSAIVEKVSKMDYKNSVIKSELEKIKDTWSRFEERHKTNE